MAPKTGLSHFYYCAYGPLLRCTSAKNEVRAAIETFGTIERVTVVKIGRKNPLQGAIGKMRALQEEIFRLHLRLTGNQIESVLPPSAVARILEEERVKDEDLNSTRIVG